MVEVCRNGGGIFVAEVVSDRSHLAAAAISAPEHLELEFDVMPVLSGEIWNGRCFSGPIGSVTIDATLDTILEIAFGRNVLTAGNQIRRPLSREAESGLDGGVVCGDVLDLLVSQILGDGAHYRILARAGRETSQLLCQIECRLPGQNWESSAAVGSAVVAMAARACDGSLLVAHRYQLRAHLDAVARGMRSVWLERRAKAERGRSHRKQESVLTQREFSRHSSRQWTRVFEVAVLQSICRPVDERP